MRFFALCLLVCAAACGKVGGEGGDGPTWYKDVAVITQKQCVNCHVAGGIAPFALESYEQAKPMAAAMKAAVQERRMPPWMPDPACGAPFRDERILSQEEIDTLSNWADTGAAEGNVKDAPPPPVPLNTLERIDATVAMPEAYTPSVDRPDDYRCFMVDPQITSATQLVGYDILPGNRKIVHHVILYVTDRAEAEKAEKRDDIAGWECFGGANVKNGGAAGAWAPGTPATMFPAGTGIPLGPGKVLAMQVHYNTAAGTGSDLTTVNLMYATSRMIDAYLVPVVDDDFSIPPMAENYSHGKDFGIGLPIRVWGMLPHMHTKGQHITITAKGPSGDTCLVSIPKWDFHWQQQYFRPTAYSLKGDEKMRIDCTWSNPTSRTVTWGEGTDDEMCFAYVYATF